MKTTIVEQEQQAKPDDSYPRLWRMCDTGSVWLETRDMAFVINAGGCFQIGERVTGASAHSFPAHTYERITTPITIRFEP